MLLLIERRASPRRKICAPSEQCEVVAGGIRPRVRFPGAGPDFAGTGASDHRPPRLASRSATWPASMGPQDCARNDGESPRDARGCPPVLQSDDPIVPALAAEGARR